MAPFSVDTLSGSPTLMMGLSFFFWIPMSVAFGRRPLILLSAVMMSVGSLWAGFTNDYHQLLGAICLMGLAGGATLSTVCHIPLHSRAHKILIRLIDHPPTHRPDIHS